MTEERPMCPDCRCYLTTDNRNPFNDSKYCDPCLLDHLKAGEKIQTGTFTDQNGKERHGFLVLCGRCKGTGEVLYTAWQEDLTCFNCGGFGYIFPDREEVQRMHRWSETYQQNRDPEKGKYR